MFAINTISRIGCLVLSICAIGLTNCTQLSAEEKKAKHQERGRAYFDEGKYQEALIEFKNVVQLDPKNAKAYHQLALIHLKLGGMPDLRSAFGNSVKPLSWILLSTMPNSNSVNFICFLNNPKRQKKGRKLCWPPHHKIPKVICCEGVA